MSSLIFSAQLLCMAGSMMHIILQLTCKLHWLCSKLARTINSFPSEVQMLIVLNIENTNVETGLFSGPNKFGDIIIKRGFQFEILGLSMKPWYFNSEKRSLLKCQRPRDWPLYFIHSKNFTTEMRQNKQTNKQAKNKKIQLALPWTDRTVACLEFCPWTRKQKSSLWINPSSRQTNRRAA